ncbi:uncharacterized protein CANTADRAFT_53825 [Suhomyces tanzawaensis NRRL Y-17324]|uniref:CHY-type domain-containing protein n=1 Tax=Suhomyces tanzawaensis NRRL Y-17324 TaxID=984487 RepID=A0A1E4SH75_9ASCO|nr:uncharacterized protein CANTADRAFT_53825 [Suhomyces tanzawaensis NRRL Y-17324]ODV78858.1 hypothetical protein CANTADRAFT_53825 [Suhomyces tanzawaensis NRRL Y-17324]
MTTPFILGTSTVPVYGRVVDSHTRCFHYHTELDIIAIKFRCCGDYYPCYQCHDEATREHHEPMRWAPHELDHAKVVLCGQCYSELTFRQYAGGPSASCIRCSAGFNPKCALHYHIYFDMGSAKAE